MLFKEVLTFKKVSLQHRGRESKPRKKSLRALLPLRTLPPFAALQRGNRETCSTRTHSYKGTNNN